MYVLQQQAAQQLLAMQANNENNRKVHASTCEHLPPAQCMSAAA
jgi:hypothetical protein